MHNVTAGGVVLNFNRHINKRARRKKKRPLSFLLPTFLIAIALFFYFINMKLTPIYIRYAEVQTTKIASHVINQAIQSRNFSEINVNEIFGNVPNDSTGMVTNTINAEIVGRVMAEIQGLVEASLKQAESGNYDILPLSDDIEYDVETMKNQGGVVFFVPLGQATGIPLLGNLGPKIPIRFHIIGEVQATTDTEIREFGLNNAFVEVSVLVTVNVQIIVPLATRNSRVQQKVPVAMTIIQSPIPQILNKGDGNNPQIEVPLAIPGNN